MPKTYGIRLKDSDCQEAEKYLPEGVVKVARRLVLEEIHRRKSSKTAVESPTTPVTAPLAPNPPPSRGKNKEGFKKPLQCDHAGTLLGEFSGVGACPKCGRVVTRRELK